MYPKKVQDPDLIELYTKLIDDEIEKEIFRIVFSENTDEERLDKLIDFLEISNDQD